MPFLSALPSEREINVEPRLAFTLDGSRFDSAAVATPFAEHGAGTVKIRLDRFDVGPWLGYLPPSLPVRLQSGLVSADLSLAFEQRPKLSLRLHGDVGVADLKVADADAGDLLQVGSVKVRIDDLRPLERTAKLARIDIEAPHVLGVRNAAGKVNLLLAAETPSGGAVPVARVPLPTTAASAASSAGPSSGKPTSAASGAAAGAPAPGWKASLAALSIRAGQLDWRDATTSPPAALAVQDFSFDAQAIAWPLEAPVVFKGEGVVGAAKDQGKLAFSGEGNAAGATVKIGLDDLPLVVARPYLQGLLRPPLAGALSADLTLDWKPGDGRAAAARRRPADRGRRAAARRPEGPRARGRADRAARCARRHRRAGARPSASWRCRRRGCASIATPRAAGMPQPGKARSHRPRPRRRGRPAGAGDRVVRARASAPAASAASAPWRLTLGTLAIDKGRASFTDRSLAAPVALDLLDLSLQVQSWALDGTAAMPFQVRTRVAVPAGQSGRAVGAGVVGSGRRAGRAEGQRRRRAAEREGDAGAQGPAAAPARSLPRRAGRARRPEGADQLQGHGRLGAQVRRRQPGAARRRQHRRLPRRQPGGCGARARAAAWRWSARPAAGRRSSTGNRCRCAASTSRSRPARRPG